MTLWGIAAAAYGWLFVVAAVTQPIRRRAVALTASIVYAAAAVGAGRLPDAFWVNFLAPGALLLSGYWLSGFFFRDPQPWLESWLLRTDRAIGAEQWMARVPRPVAEFLELSYAADYLVVGGGAIYAATFGTEAVAHYWSLVLAAELASFAPLPWLRSRPPRALADQNLPHDRNPRRKGACPIIDNRRQLQTGDAADYQPRLRRLNTAILDNASVQANTLPSGHVSGAVAAALGVMAVDVVVGWWLVGVAGVIAVAAIAGRYHYGVDCAAGAVVALVFWSLM